MRLIDRRAREHAGSLFRSCCTDPPRHALETIPAEMTIVMLALKRHHLAALVTSCRWHLSEGREKLELHVEEEQHWHSGGKAALIAWPQCQFHSCFLSWEHESHLAFCMTTIVHCQTDIYTLCLFVCLMHPSKWQKLWKARVSGTKDETILFKWCDETLFFPIIGRLVHPAHFLSWQAVQNFHFLEQLSFSHRRQRTFGGARVCVKASDNVKSPWSSSRAPAEMLISAYHSILPVIQNLLASRRGQTYLQRHDRQQHQPRLLQSSKDSFLASHLASPLHVWLRSYCGVKEEELKDICLFSPLLM